MPRHPQEEHRWEHHDPRLPVDPDLAPDDPAEPSLVHHPGAHVHRAREHDVLAAIAAGGFLGALGRYELGLAWPTGSGHVPWATFTVNVSGAFLLGLVLTLLLERFAPNRYARPFLCVGVLGAWTTMSTFSVETDLLVRDGYAGAAVAYVVATVVVGLAAGWLGLLLARVPWRSR
jgi:CrcB protein